MRFFDEHGNEHECNPKDEQDLLALARLGLTPAPPLDDKEASNLEKVGINPSPKPEAKKATKKAVKADEQ